MAVQRCSIQRHMCRFVNEYDSELTVKTYCFAVTLMAFWSGAMDLALSAVQMKLIM